MLTEISGIYIDCCPPSLPPHIRVTLLKKMSLLPCSLAQLMVEFPCDSLKNNGFIVNISSSTEGSLMPTMSPAWTGIPGGEGVYSILPVPIFGCNSFVMFCCMYLFNSNLHVVICGMSAMFIDSGMLLLTLSVQLVI